MALILASLALIGAVLVPISVSQLTENELNNHQTHPINPKSPASPLFGEIDILKLINISIKDQGVSLVDGPIHQYAAYKFRLPYDNIPLANTTDLTKILNNHAGFTVVFVYRQQRNTVGTLLSINSPGRLTPWFQLTANSKTGILTLKYRQIRNGSAKKLQQIDWSLPRHYKKSPLAAWIWLSLSIDINNDIVRLDLDCQPSQFDTLNINNANEQHFLIPADSLVYFRQEPGRKKKFLGSMQVVKILPYINRQRLWACIEISTSLTPEFRKPIV